MTVLLAVLAAAALGALTAYLLRRAPARRRLRGAPREVEAVLGSYRRGRWAAVADDAPPMLARPGAGDERWRPALELALGHSLAELDRFEEAIPHLERGLLLQAALRHAAGEGDRPVPGEAKLRHVLGYAYARAGRTGAARREYRRVLDTPGLDPDVRAGVERSLDGLSGG